MLLPSEVPYRSVHLGYSQGEVDDAIAELEGMRRAAGGSDCADAHAAPGHSGQP